MGALLSKIAAWLCSSLRVPVPTVHELVDKCDADKDGYISLGELIKLASGWIRGLKR